MHGNVQRSGNEAVALGRDRRAPGLGLAAGFGLEIDFELDRDEAEAAVVARRHVACSLDLEPEQWHTVPLGDRDERDREARSRCGDREVFRAPDPGDAALEVGRCRDL